MSFVQNEFLILRSAKISRKIIVNIKAKDMILEKNSWMTVIIALAERVVVYLAQKNFAMPLVTIMARLTMMVIHFPVVIIATNVHVIMV
jgi:hypothetical protein